MSRWCCSDQKPKSSSTQKSLNFSVILGDAKIRYFTSAFPGRSFVYVRSLSFSFVKFCSSVYYISRFPSLLSLSCPKFSCLQLKSPVSIVLSWRVQMLCMISCDVFLCGQYNVAI